MSNYVVKSQDKDKDGYSCGTSVLYTGASLSDAKSAVSKARKGARSTAFFARVPLSKITRSVLDARPDKAFVIDLYFEGGTRSTVFLKLVIAR